MTEGHVFTRNLFVLNREKRNWVIITSQHISGDWEEGTRCAAHTRMAAFPTVDQTQTSHSVWVCAVCCDTVAT